MEKELFTEFVASYFYKKGRKDAKLSSLDDSEYKNLSEYLIECKKAYKAEIDEKRKENPHHHTNRLD
jgi:hypothetical protein